ncbi:MAG: helix-turn-helix domain-containing protein, partial [Actinomycetota bacterium]|nr:helix-turn-helix domain-containing protein [Actinomycetota bacterium]
MTDFVVDRELEIRRNATLNGLVGLLAAGLGIAFLWRASGTGALWDFAFCAVLLLVGAMQLVALVDARTPLLLADSLGVRIRLGREWRGLPWGALDQVVVETGDSGLRDGRLVLSPRNLTSALADLDRASRRQVRWLQRWYGAPLTVPLSISTRCSSSDLVGDLRALVDGRTDVVQLVGKQRAQLEDAPADTLALPEPPQRTESDEVPAAPSGPKVPRRRVIGNLGTLVSRVGKGRAQDIDAQSTGIEPSGQPFAPAATYQPVAPLRETRRALRAEVTRDVPATLGNTALLPDEATSERSVGLPEGDALRRQSSGMVFDDLTENMAPIARPGDPIAPVVVDDFVTEPALDPVIGPELAAARTRLGLSIDELSDRTRIRPHLLECIEVDDFAPCGGDFYARGHLRTLARVLGLDATPLLASYDERYAHAPINAR